MIHRRQARRHIGHGHRAAEQERPSALAQPIDDDLFARHHAADHAKRFAHRADFNIDLAVQVKVIHDAAPALAQNAFAVRVIDHQQDIVFLRHSVQFRQRRDVAVHAEHAIGDDQTPSITRSCFDLFAQVVGIGMRKPDDLARDSAVRRR